MKSTSGLHYTIVQIGNGARCQGIPAIVTNEAGGTLLYEAFYFLTRIPYIDRSRTWKREAIRAIGRLYDYYRLFRHLYDLEKENEAGTFIAKFLETQRYGSSWDLELEVHGLKWDALSRDDYSKTIFYLSEFFQTISEVRRSPLSNAAFKEMSLSVLRSAEARRRHGDRRSLLYHVSKTSRMDQFGSFYGRSSAGKQSVRVRAKHFPFEALEDLIVEGCRLKRRRSEFSGIASEYNLNLLLSILLCAGAGLRSSELFHLFVRDVSEKSVRLFHPEHGTIRVNEKFISREQYLREYFGRVPRTKASGAQWSGFKSMLMTEKESKPEGQFAVAHFLPEKTFGIPFQDWFYSVFRVYTLEVYPASDQHPYLLVNTSRSESFGQPWTKTAMRDAFDAAVRKIGLEPDQSKGVHPHGLRHLYGQTLKSSGVSPLVIQNCMHHISLESQLAYTSPSSIEVNTELSALTEAMTNGSSFTHKTRNVEFLGLRYKSDPAGIFTHGKLGIGNDALR